MTLTTDHVYDHSLLSTLTHCERKAFYRYIMHLRARGVESPLLVAGGALHTGLEVLYREGFGALEDAIERMRSDLEKSAWNPIGKFDYMSAGHLEVVLRNYVKHWQDQDPYEVVEAVEEPIIGSLGTTIFGGIPDLIVRDQTGKLLVLDHKCTSSYIGSHQYNRTKFQHQTRLYCVLAAEKLGEEVRGSVVNALYMGKSASSASTKATLFDRWRFDYSREELAEATEWAVRSAGRFERARKKNSEDESAWLKNGGSHCGWCEFNELCSAPPPLRQSRINARFERREPTGKLLSGADS